MSALPIPWFSPEQYLEIERAAERPSEYWDGEIVPIEAATGRHASIVLNLGAELRSALKGRECRAFAQPRIRIAGRGPFTVPDLVVACPAEFADGREELLTNPLLLIEVLSDSTERRDRGDKFHYSRNIPSLEEYVLVSQHFPRVESFRRQPAGAWLFTEAEGRDAMLTLSSLNVTIPLAEIYDKVEFDEPAATGAAGDVTMEG